MLMQPNHKWVQLACGLIGTMLATPEGLKYLGEDKLLKQLSECFVELETVSDNQHVDRSRLAADGRNPSKAAHTCLQRGWRAA